MFWIDRQHNGRGAILMGGTRRIMQCAHLPLMYYRDGRKYGFAQDRELLDTLYIVFRLTYR
jgi:hypothetical protein